MKKSLIVFLLCLLAMGIIWAQAVPNYGAVDSAGYSVMSNATFSLFTNELDAASSADERTTGVGFTDLERNYLFAGILGNPQSIRNNNSSTNATAGFFNYGDMPWSLFGTFTFFGSDVASHTTTNDNGAGTVISYDSKAFTNMNLGLDFLMDIGMGTTGLSLDFHIKDNRDLTLNFTNEAPGQTTTRHDYRDAGNPDLDGYTGSRTLIEASVPFYMEMEDMSHYAVLSYEYSGRNSSFGTSYSSEGPGNYSTATVDEDSDNTLALFYKLSLPVGDAGNTLAAYTDFAIGFHSEKNSTENGDPAIDATSIETKSTPLLRFELGTELYMNLIDKEWFDLRARPDFSYSLLSNDYIESGTSTTGATSTDLYTAKAVNSVIVNTFALGLDLGAEMKPEDWFLGFMAGSSIDLSLAITSSENNTSLIAGGGATTDDDGVIKGVAYDWSSGVNYNFGVYILLPEEYRLDMNINSQNITSFENFTVQLIIPLDSAGSRSAEESVAETE